MKIDFSEVIFMDESRVRFDRAGRWPKDEFYSIQTCLWLKEGNKEAIG